VNLHDTMLAVIAAMSLSSCCTNSICGCDPDSEEFELDEPLTTEKVDELVATWGVESADELSCEQVCTSVYEETRGWTASGIEGCTLALPEATDGSIVCAGTGYEYLCEGRRPLGHVEATGDRTLGGTLARMAHLEAASVEAFEELAVQLRELHAPQALIERCLDAAEDERAHARWLGALASRRGASVPPCRAEPGPASLLDIALHNAVEGCVHETWAALTAHLRARTAADPRLRALFARIASDETRHGQLAWDLHAWFLTQLDAPDRARVHEAQARALAALPERAAATAALPGLSGAELGRIDPQLAAALAQRLAA
jgi:rubrerythrin